MPPAPTDRCAAHPSRPAVDACPVCDRLRCDADRALASGTGCAVCRVGDTPKDGVRRGAQHRELLLRATLAANAVAIAWGYVTAQYVGSDLFQYLSPAVLGVLSGGAATAAAGSPGHGALLHRIRLIAVTYAVLGTALGFVLEGTYPVAAPSTDVLIPYVIAAGGAWLWTTPPRKRR